METASFSDAVRTEVCQLRAKSPSRRYFLAGLLCSQASADQKGMPLKIRLRSLDTGKIEGFFSDEGYKVSYYNQTMTLTRRGEGSDTTLLEDLVLACLSGTLPEESSFYTSIGHPISAVCIRTSTERPEALDKACFVLAGIDEKNLLQAVDIAVEMTNDDNLGTPVPDYIDENVSTKVVKLIQSYTGVVDKMVWRKK